MKTIDLSPLGAKAAIKMGNYQAVEKQGVTRAQRVLGQLTALVSLSDVGGAPEQYGGPKQ